MSHCRGGLFVNPAGSKPASPGKVPSKAVGRLSKGKAGYRSPIILSLFVNDPEERITKEFVTPNNTTKSKVVSIFLLQEQRKTSTLKSTDMILPLKNHFRTFDFSA